MVLLGLLGLMARIVSYVDRGFGVAPPLGLWRRFVSFGVCEVEHSKNLPGKVLALLAPRARRHPLLGLGVEYGVSGAKVGVCL